MLGLRKIAVLLVILWIAACSGAEREVVNSFLTAVQSGNEAAVNSLSVVEFPGDVASWEIVEIGPASTEPFALAELMAKRSELSKERRSAKEENEAFLEKHKSAFEEYTAKREDDPDYEFSGELADFQKQWEAKVKKQQEDDRVGIDLEKEINRLRAAASLSVSSKVNEKFEGELTGKELTLRVHDGSTEKTLAFTLWKFNIVDKGRNMSPLGRWVITDIS